MKLVKLIVGLGNPTLRYKYTRHNVGFRCVEKLSEQHNIILKEKKIFLGNLGNWNIVDRQVKIFVPNVYMNISGQAVILVSNYYNIKLNNIVIIHDELDLLPGQTNFKNSLGHGGHNGIRSIINCFKIKKKFFKMSIGIGRPKEKNNVASFVLSNFSGREYLLIDKAINKTILNIESFIKSNKY